jgi:hypothetical protein
LEALEPRDCPAGGHAVPGWVWDAPNGADGLWSNPNGTNWLKNGVQAAATQYPGAVAGDIVYFDNADTIGNIATMQATLDVPLNNSLDSLSITDWGKTLWVNNS